MKIIIIKLILFLFSFGIASSQNDFYYRLADSAFTLTKQSVTYDPAYYKITYPGGDLPTDKSVCTDVIIRAYRKLGIDLQKEVHEDMEKNFSKYPNIWGLKHTDSNIDHRRVPNLMFFFKKYGTVKKITDNPADYLPGDIVCWDLGGGIHHIGIIASKKSADKKRYLVIHNIGAGQVLEDCLFEFKITGHFRYRK